MSEMVMAGAHKLTYRDYKGRHLSFMASSVSTLSGPWLDITKNMIPAGGKPFVQCPKCKANNWTDDSAQMNGYSCDSCGYEILAV